MIKLQRVYIDPKMYIYTNSFFAKLRGKKIKAGIYWLGLEKITPTKREKKILEKQER